MKNWRYWNEQILLAPIMTHLFAKCVLVGLKPSDLLKANYGLPLGGLNIAGKSEINALFNEEYMLPSAKIPATETILQKNKILKTFMKENNLSYPVFFKPDKGREGKGAVIIENETKAKTFLTQIRTDYLVQEYCDWSEEYGVFYIKTKTKEEIFSISKKTFLSIKGDGKHSVKQLLKKKKMYDTYKNVIKKEILETIIPLHETKQVLHIDQEGEQIDVSFLATKKLLTAIKKAIGNTSFHYGRFDVKARNDAELQKGIFKIIEVNGIQSYSTNCLDPKYSLFQAYKIMATQHSALVNIARQHKKEQLVHKPKKIFKQQRKNEKELKKNQKIAIEYR